MQNTTKQVDNKNGNKAPPFILYGVTKNIQELLLIIKKHAPTFTYKILQEEKMKVQVTSSDEYKSLRKEFESNKIIFHTFPLPEEKTFRVVLRSIHHSTPPQEITNALAEMGIYTRKNYEYSK